MLGAAPGKAPSSAAANRFCVALLVASVFVIVPAAARAASLAHGPAKSPAMPRLWTIQVSGGRGGWFDRTLLKGVRDDGINALALRVSTLGRSRAATRVFSSVLRFAAAEKLYVVAVLPAGEPRTPAAKRAVAACSSRRLSYIRCAVQAPSASAAVKLSRANGSRSRLVAVYLNGPGALSGLAHLSRGLRRRILAIAPLDPAFDASAWADAIGQTAANNSVFMGAAPRTPGASPAVQQLAKLLAVGSTSESKGSGHPDKKPPSSPSRLVTSSATQTSLTISWEASTDNVGVAGYRLFLDGAEAGTSTSTGYSFTGLRCGTRYTVSVIAYDAAGNVSRAATTAHLTSACVDTQAPSTPAGLTVASVSQSSISLSWSASNDNVGVAGYRLFRNGVLVGASISTTYSFRGLSCGTRYTVAVVAYDAAGNVSGGATIAHSTSACVDTQAPSTPSALVVGSGTQSSLSLSWAASSDNVGVAGYRLFRNGVSVGTSTSTSYSFSGLNCGVLYALGVAAYDAAGNASRTATVVYPSAACAVSGTANVWIAPTGSSSCTRSASAIDYSTAQSGGNVCDTFNRALAVSQAGDEDRVPCGDYSAQSPRFDALAYTTASNALTSNVTFSSADDTAACVILPNGGFTVSAPHVTVQHFQFDKTACVDSVSSGYTSVPCPSVNITDQTAGSASAAHDVVMDDLHASLLNIAGPVYNVTVDNSDFGPSWDYHGLLHCHGSANPCTLMPHDILIENSSIHDYYNTTGCKQNVPVGCMSSHHQGCALTVNNGYDITFDRDHIYNCEDMAFYLHPYLSEVHDVTVENSDIGRNAVQSQFQDDYNASPSGFGAWNIKFIDNTWGSPLSLLPSSVVANCAGQAGSGGCEYFGNIGLPVSRCTGKGSFGSGWDVEYNASTAAYCGSGTLLGTATGAARACNPGATCQNNYMTNSYGLAADGYHLAPGSNLIHVLPPSLPWLPADDVDGVTRSANSSPGAADA